MTPPINIDGESENYSNVTIDGQTVEQITVDGQEVLSTIPASGVARWTFDNVDTSNGTAIDVWNSNNGNIGSGVTTGFNGQLRESYDFDPNSQVSIPDLTSGLSAATFSAFVNLDDISNNGRIIGCSTNSFRLTLDKNGNFEARINSNSLGSPTALSGTSERITFVYDSTGLGDGDNMKIYKDESEAAGKSASEGNIQSGDKAIGNKPGSNFNRDAIDGRIDDPRIYSKALSSTEVSNLFNNGRI